jgi:hypothetical protein
MSLSGFAAEIWLYLAATDREYDSWSVCRIVALVGFLWWEGWPFARGSICLGRLLCVLGWKVVRSKFSLCVLEGRGIFYEVGEPRCFTSGRMNLEGRGGKRVSWQEMKEIEEEDRQRLQIRVGALSSTVSFVLETLSQHRNLIGQLQDEVYALRSQNEEMKFKIEQLEGNHEQSSPAGSSSQESRNESTTSVCPLPDLNEPLAEEWEKEGMPDIKQEPGS